MSLINVNDFNIVSTIWKGRNPVFKVQSKKNNEYYALKKIRRYDFQQHLSDLQEVLYLSYCDHPNIIKIFGFCIHVAKHNEYEKEYNIYVLMPLLDRSLHSELESHAYFPKPIFLSLFFKIASSLIYLQKETRIAHRDIKPENILLDFAKEPFLIDFGESFLFTRIKEEATTLVGTPDYMSPEIKKVLLKETLERPAYDPWKSDAFSFGVTMLEAGGVGKGKEFLHEVEKKYGWEVRNIIQKLTEEDPAKRIDFLQMEKMEEFLHIQKMFQKYDSPLCEEEKKNIDELKEESNIKLSLKFDKFVQKLETEKRLTEKMEDELESLVNDVAELEEENLSYRHSI